MEKRKSTLRWIGVFAIVTIISFFSASVQSVEKNTNISRRVRSDLVSLGSLNVFGNLERSGVSFPHDLHTDALEKKNKDCTVCHQTDNKRLSYKFKRLKDFDKQATMDIYHDNCIACHTEMTVAKEKTGPITCGECHKEKPTLVSSMTPMGFDKSLHYRHYKAQNKKCDRCHHEYNKKSQKLFYAKGKEGTCRYCHLKDADNSGSEKSISMRQAAHQACIECHQKTEAQHIAAGPVRCSGCHDLKERQNIVKVAHVPRIKRGQPDSVLIKTGDKKGQIPRMMQVPFSHKAHEKYNDTCRVCHLASLNSCASCHPLTATNNSKKITLKTIFHKDGHQSSCKGCHNLKQQNKNCAGCHGFIKKIRPTKSSACLRCHMVPLPERTGVLSTSKAAKMARMMPRIWRETFGPTYKVTVPKKVVINALTDRYEPVQFPHRKIFNALLKRTSGSKLAQYFHNDKTTLCRGCHHNTPSAGKPPKCNNCHGKPFDEAKLFQPGIKGSFHRQCIGCHQIMGIKKFLSCTACHKERKQKIASVHP